MTFSRQIAKWLMLEACLAGALFCCKCQAQTPRTLRVPEQFAEIQAAIEAARSGDTVMVAPGKYTANLKIAGKQITLASRFIDSGNQNDIAHTILDGQADGAKQRTSILTVTGEFSPACRLIGFTIQNGDHAVINRAALDTLHCRFTGNSDALSFEDGRGTVRFCTFENDSDDGVDMDGASAAIIEDNVFRDNRDDGIEIRLHKYSGPELPIVIRKNTFERNREDGLQLIDYPGKSPRVFHIERNLFAANRMAAIGCMADGNTKENYAGADLLEAVFILNNTLVQNHYGIVGGDQVVLANNLIAGTVKTALKRIGGDSVAGPNLLWQNGDDREDCDLDPNVFLAADPLLSADYRLQAGSPCIDAGATSLQVNGENFVLPAEHVLGRAPDLGAFEFETPR